MHKPVQPVVSFRGCRPSCSPLMGRSLTCPTVGDTAHLSDSSGALPQLIGRATTSLSASIAHALRGAT